jgi:SanA protein
VTPRKRVAAGLVWTVTPLLVLVLLAESAVWEASAGRIVTTTGEIALKLEYGIAVVLGTSAKTNGRANRFYEARLDATQELYEAGVVRAILVSGDNGRDSYDEPTAMRDDLIERGIPAAAIWRDHAGFRTLDSMVRARAVFAIERCVVVSQVGHLRRAIYLARAHGVDAYGYAAAGLGGAPGMQQFFRERLAVLAAYLDVTVFDRQPRFLGPQIRVGVDPAQ